MQYGFILTSARDIASLEAAARAGAIDVLKVVTGWGLPWTDQLRAQALRVAPASIVRTVQGDPSVAGGQYAMPHPEQIIGELAPWYAARDPERPLWVELGNEPLIRPDLTDDRAFQYGYYLNLTITACRQAFPKARIIAPAHMLDHPVAVGNVAWGQGRYLEVQRELYRRCDAIGLHAYTREQLTRGRDLVATAIGADHPPLYLTECNVNALLDEADRARAIAELVRGVTLAGVTLYHLDELAGSNPAHFSPAYRLTPAALAAIGIALRTPAQPAAPERPRVLSVPMTCEHLTRGRQHGPVQALVIHATAGRYPGDLKYLRQGGTAAKPVSVHYYIDRAGTISQLVADFDTAWHAGASRWRGLEVDGSLNAVSIGVELENLNTGRDPYPAAQIAALVALARHLVSAHHIARENLVRHLDIAPGRKTDPAGLDWPAFVAQVYGGLR